MVRARSDLDGEIAHVPWLAERTSDGGFPNETVGCSDGDIVRRGSGTGGSRRSGAGGVGRNGIGVGGVFVLGGRAEGRGGTDRSGVGGSGVRRRGVGGSGSKRLEVDFESSLSEVIVLPRFVGDDEIGGSRYAALVGLFYVLGELLQLSSRDGEVEG